MGPHLGGCCSFKKEDSNTVSGVWGDVGGPVSPNCPSSGVQNLCDALH